MTDSFKIGDVTMSEGMSYDEETFLKIGFLNDKVERLPQYLEVYDLVVLNDPDFSVPLGVVNEICEMGAFDDLTRC